MSRLAELRSTVAELERTWSALRAGGGNPNHDAEGKFASAPGGHGKHWAKRQRRKKREQFRRKWKGIAKKARRDWRGYYREHRAEHASRQRTKRKEHVRELTSTRKQLLGERDTLRSRHQAERRAEIESHKDTIREEMTAARKEGGEDRDTIREAGRKRIRESLGELHERHTAEREKLHQAHRDRWSELRESHRDELAEMHEEYLSGKEGIRQDIADERAALLSEMREDMAKHGFKKKTRKAKTDEVRLLARALHSGRYSHLVRRLSPARTVKASSAESILRLCLRQLGWSREWRRGDLGEAELIQVLDSIREYGKVWMRHEAEGLFRHHGSERALGEAMRHHVGRFFGRAKQFVRELIVAGAMALNGPEPLDVQDLNQIDRQAQVQAEFLDRFQRDVEVRTPVEIAPPAAAPPPPPPPGVVLIPTEPAEPKPMSKDQFVARSEEYGGSAWGNAINARRDKMIRLGGFTEERRVHAKPLSEHDACGTCQEASARGWVPIGTLPPIGDSECLGIHCDCWFQYRGPKAAPKHGRPSPGLRKRRHVA